MVGAGGETRSTIGNVDPNTVLTSGTVISGAVTFTNAAVTTLTPTTMNVGTLNVSGGITVSGGANLQNVTGFFWRGAIFSGRAGGVGGGTISGTYLHIEDGFISIDLSGQKVWIAYWNSA